MRRCLSAAGAYFVTVCVQGRDGLFGEVVGGEMVLSEARRMVEQTWMSLPERFPVCLAEFQKQMAEPVPERHTDEHIRNIFAEDELVHEAVVRDFRITASDGKSYSRRPPRGALVIGEELR